MVNSPKTPEKNPTSGNQNQTSDSHERATMNVPAMARKKPAYISAMERR